MKSVETYAPEFLLLIFLATVGVIRLIFGELDLTNNLLNCEILMHLQLNEYETNPYFLQFFQGNTTVCFIIYVFCKLRVQKREPEIVLKKPKQKTAQESKQNHFTFTFRFTKPTKRGNQQCHGLEILKKIWICLTFI